jgi:hypothetical protein
MLTRNASIAESFDGGRESPVRSILARPFSRVNHRSEPESREQVGQPCHRILAHIHNRCPDEGVSLISVSAITRRKAGQGLHPPQIGVS